MKFFILLLAVGFASASVIDDILDQSVNEIVADFAKGLDEAPKLYAAEDEPAATEVKNQLVEALQNTLKDTIAKIKDRVDEKHQKAQDLIEKAKELADRLKQLRADLGAKGKDFLEELKGKVSEKVNAIIEKIATGGKKNTESEDVEEYSMIQDLAFDMILSKVKEQFAQNMDLNKVKDMFGNLFSEENREALKNAARRGKDALKSMIENIMNRNNREKRQVNDVAEKVKGLLGDLGLNFKERYGQFAEWLKGAWGKAMDSAKDKHAKLTEIAKEVRDHAKDMKQESVKQAVEILRPFKEQLGSLWQELLTSAKAVISKKEE